MQICHQTLITQSGGDGEERGSRDWGALRDPEALTGEEETPQQNTEGCKEMSQRGGRRWGASLLALGICQASGQIDINPDSLIGVETYRTRLVLENGPEDAQAYSWHRGANDTEENMIVSYNVTSDSQQNGPMFTGRESVLKTGDLHIRGSQLNDTGNYTVRVDAINGTQRATGWLKIQELEIPGISVNATSVVEDIDSVAAICYTNDTNVMWYVNSAPVSSNNRMTISPDTKTLIIQRIERFDSPLQCSIEIIPEIFGRSELIQLTVAYGPYGMTLTSMPNHLSGVVSAEIGTPVEMKCTAYSRPESQYRWFHNGSLLSFSGENISLPSLTWDQMGSYRCVVGNSVTQLTFYQRLQVQVPWRPKPAQKRVFTVSGSYVVVLIVVTVLGGVVFCATLIYILFKHYSTRG